MSSLFKSALKTVDSAIGIGLATGGVVLAVYSHSIPNLTEIRMTDPHNGDVEAQRKHAATTSALLIGAVFAVTRDRNVLIIAGTTMIAADYMVKHTNGIDPATKRLDAPPRGTIAPDMATPLPDYGEVDSSIAYA